MKKKEVEKNIGIKIKAFQKRCPFCHKILEVYEINEVKDNRRPKTWDL